MAETEKRFSESRDGDELHIRSQREFYQVCRANRIRLRRDEDGYPVTWARSKRFRGYSIAWNDTDELVLMTPNDERPRRSKSTLRLLRETASFVKMLQYGDTEWNAAFPAKDLLRVAKAFGMIRADRGASPERMAEMRAAKKSLDSREITGGTRVEGNGVDIWAGEAETEL